MDFKKRRATLLLFCRPIIAQTINTLNLTTFGCKRMCVSACTFFRELDDAEVLIETSGPFFSDPLRRADLIRSYIMGRASWRQKCKCSHQILSSWSTLLPTPVESERFPLIGVL